MTLDERRIFRRCTTCGAIDGQQVHRLKADPRLYWPGPVDGGQDHPHSKARDAGSERFMNTPHYTLRLGERDRKSLALVAKVFDCSESEAIRLLIRGEATSIKLSRRRVRQRKRAAKAAAK